MASASAPTRPCPTCGDAVQLADSDEFCSQCGSHVAAAEQAHQHQAPRGSDGRDAEALERQVQRLLEALGIGSGAVDHAVPPAPPSALSGLATITVPADDPVFVQATVTVAHRKFRATAAAFGDMRRGGRCNGQARLMTPQHGCDALPAPAPGASGDTVLACARGGGCSFARKALRAAAHGARGLIVMQTEERWPYVMSDSAGEWRAWAQQQQQQAGAADMAIVMISQADGAALLRDLQAGASPPCEISWTPPDSMCAICRTDMAGEECKALPCLHLYHTECIAAWFERSASCPLCRTTVSAASAASPAEPPEDARAQWYL